MLDAGRAPIHVSMLHDHGVVRGVVRAPVTRSPANLDPPPDRPGPRLPRRAWRDLVPRTSRVPCLDSGTKAGGDVTRRGGAVPVGLSEGTDRDGAAALRRLPSAQPNPREGVPLTFSHGGIIRFGTSLGVLGLALAKPATLGGPSLRLPRDRFSLVEATEAEARDAQVGGVPPGRGRVVVKDGAHRPIDGLARHGQAPAPVRRDDATWPPGSVRCTTLPQRRNAA